MKQNEFMSKQISARPLARCVIRNNKGHLTKKKQACNLKCEGKIEAAKKRGTHNNSKLNNLIKIIESSKST
jgi:hypothetical protein